MTLFPDNHQIETNPKTISEAFNKFFSKAAKDIDNKIIPNNKTHKDYLHVSVVNSFFLTTINHEVIRKGIKWNYKTKRDINIKEYKKSV